MDHQFILFKHLHAAMTYQHSQSKERKKGYQNWGVNMGVTYLIKGNFWFCEELRKWPGVNPSKHFFTYLHITFSDFCYYICPFHGEHNFYHMLKTLQLKIRSQRKSKLIELTASFIYVYTHV